MKFRIPACIKSLAISLNFIPFLLGAQWTYVGPAGLSSGWCYTNDIAIDTSGAPVVVLQGDSTTVLRYEGGQWDPVGAATFTSLMYDVMKLIIDKQNNYFLFYRTHPDTYPACIKFDGISWNDVGAATIINNYAGDFTAAIDSGGVLYCFFNSASGYYFLKLNGNSWQSLPLSGLQPYLGYYSLQIDQNNDPVLAFTDLISLGANCMKFTGTNWTQVGNANFSSYYTDNIKLVITPADEHYVAFNMNNGTHVMKYNSITNIWDSILFPWTHPDYSGVSDFISAPDGNIFLTTSIWANGRARCVKYDGSAWTELGANGVNDTTAGRPNIALDNNGTMFASYNDFGIGKGVVKQFNGAVGEKELVSEISVDVFPNPAGDFLNIKLNTEGDKNIQIRIMNALGQNIFCKNIRVNEKLVRLPVSDLKRGIYFLILQDDGRTCLSRFIKT